MKQVWKQLSFRNRLSLGMIGGTFCALAILGGIVRFYIYHQFTSHALDLLALSNTASMRLFHELTENIKPPGLNKDLIRLLTKGFVDRIGLGKSGETYLLAEDGTVLTESRFTDSPARVPIPENIGERWAGKKRDYRNVPVFAVWSRVRLGSFNGFIASEIDASEVEQPADAIEIILFSARFVIFGLVVFLSAVLSQTIAARDERASKEERVRHLALIEGQERERTRIGLELHDDIGQELAALLWRINDLKLSETERKQILEATQNVATKTKALAAGLLNEVISSEGIGASIQRLIAQTKPLTNRKNIDLELSIIGREPQDLKPELSIGLYRVVQEALNNILKHSSASRAQVQLNFASNGSLIATIQDNGTEFSPDRKGKHLGLRTMQVRAEALGGGITFNYSNGFNVTAHFPKECHEPSPRG